MCFLILHSILHGCDYCTMSCVLPKRLKILQVRLVYKCKENYLTYAHFSYAVYTDVLKKFKFNYHL